MIDEKLKVLDLFSGIGGFGLGLDHAFFEMLSFETIAFVEIEPFCQKVLKKHWPEVPVVSDIRKLSATRTGQVVKLFYEGVLIYEGAINVVCGGFPCQPFSHAGKRGGTKDDRHLWPEMLRIISEIKPDFVIGENVSGLKSMAVKQLQFRMESRTLTTTEEFDHYEAVYFQQEKMLLADICEELELVGYAIQPFTIPACAVNAPHRRDRIWIIAYAEHHGFAAMPQPGSNGAHVSGCKKGAKCAKQLAGVCQPSNVADTNGNGKQQQKGQQQEGGERVSDGGETMADANSQRRCGGQAGKQNAKNVRQSPGRSEFRNWHVEPGMGRVADGVPGRVDRLKGLGNAVVPQVVEMLGNFILEFWKWKKNRVM